MIHIWIESQANLLRMKLRKRLATRLKTIKGDQTQAEFSRRIGIGQASLNRLLNAEQAATIDMIETICRNLRLDITDLFHEASK